MATASYPSQLSFIRWLRVSELHRQGDDFVALPESGIAAPDLPEIGLTDEICFSFLQRISVGFTPTKAARSLKLPLLLFAYKRLEDKEFAEQWGLAECVGTQTIADDLLQRMIDEGSPAAANAAIKLLERKTPMVEKFFDALSDSGTMEYAGDEEEQDDTHAAQNLVVDLARIKARNALFLQQRREREQQEGAA